MAPTRHPRSRTGCWICRLRKKKCDEAKPTCQQCKNLKIQCDGYGISQPAWMKDPEAAKEKKEEIKLQIGKRGRRRRKNRARVGEDFGLGNDSGTCTRTKEEENSSDEYDIIIASFMSSSRNQALGSSETSDYSASEMKLVKSYIRNVFRSIFCGMSESRIHETLRSVIVPLLCTCPGFGKGCMSNSVMHLTISCGQSGPHIKDLSDAYLKYSTECVERLLEVLVDEGPSEQSLALMLLLISPEVPPMLSSWKLHLWAAVECLVQMDLLNRPIYTATTQFMMSRVIWLDILSALTLGRAPQLWANYREILSRPVHERSYCGLLGMTGCDDTVMFLVSEVMCVEDYKIRSLDDGMLSWTRGRRRAMELDTRLRDRDLPVTVQLPPSPEPPEVSQLHNDYDSDDDINGYLLSPSPSWTTSSPRSPLAEYESPHHSFASPGPHIEAPLWTSPSSTKSVPTLRDQSVLGCTDCPNEYKIPPEVIPDQGIIIRATTAAFRTATRIHLWSIGIGFFPRLKFFKQLLQELMVVVALVPIGLSRTIMWPLLVGGCIAIEPQDREYFASRCTSGVFLSGIAAVMSEVWRRSDEKDLKHGVGNGQEVHWRTVMRDLGMELLLV